MFLYERKFSNAAAVTLDTKGPMYQGPLTIAVLPGAGCTIDVELSYDNGRTFVNWAPGNVAAHTVATVTTGPTHIKATQVAGTNDSYIVLSR